MPLPHASDMSHLSHTYTRKWTAGVAGYSQSRRGDGSSYLAHGMLSFGIMMRANGMMKIRREAKRPIVAGPRRLPRHLHGTARRVAGHRRSRLARGSTLLALVWDLQQQVENDADVVRIIRWMLNTGAVVLTGTFAGRTF
jgi:hypothetical protein